MDLITNLHVELQKVTEELEALERHVLEQEDEVGRLINLNYQIYPAYCIPTKRIINQRRNN